MLLTIILGIFVVAMITTYAWVMIEHDIDAEAMRRYRAEKDAFERLIR